MLAHVLLFGSLFEYLIFVQLLVFIYRYPSAITEDNKLFQPDDERNIIRKME